MTKINWRRKLTSRKLWMAVAGFVSGILIFRGHSESEAAQVASLIMSGASVIAYCVGEGLADQATMIVADPEEAHQ
jgi:hypothetical protein